MKRETGLVRAVVEQHDRSVALRRGQRRAERRGALLAVRAGEDQRLPRRAHRERARRRRHLGAGDAGRGCSSVRLGSESRVRPVRCCALI